MVILIECLVNFFAILIENCKVGKMGIVIFFYLNPFLIFGIPFPSEVDPASLVIDLGKVYEKAEKINAINLQLASTLNYTIYVSSDNVNWFKIVSEKQVNGSKSYNMDNFYANDTSRNYQWYINNKIIPTHLKDKFINTAGIDPAKITEKMIDDFLEFNNVPKPWDISRLKDILRKNKEVEDRISEIEKKDSLLREFVSKTKKTKKI